MENDLKSAISDSLPDDAVQSVSSTQPDVKDVSSTPAPEVTPSPKVEQQTPFHLNPDYIAFKQRQERKFEELNRQREQELYELRQQVETLKRPKEENLNLSDEELRAKAFYEQLDRRMEDRLNAKLAEKEKVYQQELQMTRASLAALAYKEFQKRHPDVKSGSDTENLISEKVRQGYDVEDAYELVAGNQARESKIRELEEKLKAQQQVKTTQKVAANLETSSIPSTSPVGTNPKLKGRAGIVAFIDEHLKSQAAG